MSSRKISASLIFTLTAPPLKKGIVELDEKGTITAIRGSVSERELQSAEFYNGIVVPGFVNTHCHLELSHLKGSIGSGRGMGHFIGKLNSIREAGDFEIMEAAIDADRLMYNNGISAAGDISNTAHSIVVKKQSNIEWQTFIEIFGFHPSRSERAVNQARQLFSQFSSEGLKASVVPHSPYSVSDELFHKIREMEGTESQLLSFHNQESEAENRFFMTGDGPIMDHIRQNLLLDTSHWNPPGKSSLQTVLPKLSLNLPLLLVHNTYTSSEDLVFLKKFRRSGRVWLVLCPNSNIYIENRLPPVPLFRSEKMELCIGTDSPASNGELSVLSELKTIHFRFPDIPLDELLTWSCLNGARALGLDGCYGSLEPGKKPGILLITPVDLQNLSLTPESEVRRLA